MHIVLLSIRSRLVCSPYLLTCPAGGATNRHCTTFEFRTGGESLMASERSFLKKAFIGAVLAANAVTFSSSLIRTDDLFSDRKQGIEFSAQGVATAVVGNTVFTADDWRIFPKDGTHILQEEGWRLTPVEWLGEKTGNALLGTGLNKSAAGVTNGVLGFVLGLAGTPGSVLGAGTGSVVYA